MSDYRNLNSDFQNPDDPLRRFDPDARNANAAWGWIAAAVFLVVALAIVFGVGQRPGQTGTNVANNMAPPAATRMTPPTATPTPPATAPITLTPNSPAQRTP